MTLKANLETSNINIATIPVALPVKPIIAPIVTEFRNGQPIFENEPSIILCPVSERM